MLLPCFTHRNVNQQFDALQFSYSCDAKVCQGDVDIIQNSFPKNCEFIYVRYMQINGSVSVRWQTSKGRRNLWSPADGSMLTSVARNGWRLVIYGEQPAGIYYKIASSWKYC